MLIDFETETLVPITDVPKSIPGRPCLRTVWRWIELGVYGVKLETIKVGQRRYTSKEAIRRFIAQTTAAADKSRPPAASVVSTRVTGQGIEKVANHER